jgi:hypothetical protein
MSSQFVSAQTQALELAGLVLLDQNCHVVFEHLNSVHNLIVIGIINSFVCCYTCT